MKRLLTLIAAVLLGTVATAHEFRVGDIEIVHPHIPAPSATAATAAGYFTIINHGTADDRLVGISADFAKKAMLHESKVNDAGVASMSHVEVLEVPADSTVTLEPGGYHVMFMGLTAPVPEGLMVSATLTFEKAGAVEVEFMVDAPDAEHDHEAHSDAGLPGAAVATFAWGQRFGPPVNGSGGGHAHSG